VDPGLARDWLVCGSGQALGECRRCLTAFLTGHGTGRRSTALFCSHRCRVAWHEGRRQGVAPALTAARSVLEARGVLARALLHREVYERRRRDLLWRVLCARRGERGRWAWDRVGFDVPKRHWLGRIERARRELAELRRAYYG